MENISSTHEIKAATRPEQRRLLGLARRGKRESRIVKVAGGYAIGVHANKGKPWRIVVLNGTTVKLLRMATTDYLATFLKPPPVRVFDPSKLDKPEPATPPGTLANGDV